MAVMIEIDKLFTNHGWKLDDSQLDPLWKVMFDKSRPLKKDNKICGPDSSRNGEESPRTVTDPDAYKPFRKLKEELNRTKSLLDNMDLEPWRRHTTMMHLCGGITQTLKSVCEAELCTQAWTKLCTMLCQFNVLDTCCKDGEEKIVTLHLCEAPGAFIACINHLLKTKYPSRGWEWMAGTLNPYYEGNSLDSMIDDDIFIKWTLDNWNFGKDFTGNVMSYINFKDFKKKYKRGHLKPHLVTADGSMNCADKPGEQERTVFPILFWEVMTATNVIRCGGHFIFKVYVPCEEITVKLLYLVSECFKEVHLTKPGPSKPGNSELYVVCLSFTKKGDAADTVTAKLPFLSSSFELQKYENVLESVSPTAAFMEGLVNLSQHFANLQMSVINENIRTYKRIDRSKEKFIKGLKGAVGRAFITRFQMKGISSEARVVPLKVSRQSSFSKRDESVSYRSGSLTDRQLLSQAKWIKQLHEYEKLSYDNATQFAADYMSALGGCRKFFHQHNTVQTKDILKSETGKKLEKCETSKLCVSTAMHDLFTVLQHSAELHGTTGKGSKTTWEVNCLKSHEATVSKDFHEFLDILLIDSCISDMKKHSSILIYARCPDKLTEHLRSKLSPGIIACGSYDASFDVECKAPLRIRLRSGSERIGDKHGVMVRQTMDCVIWMQDEMDWDEFRRKKQKVEHLITVLATLREGGELIIRMQHTFTNFTLGMFSLLSRLFERFSMIPSPFGPAKHATRYAMFEKYKGLDTEVFTHLVKTHYNLTVAMSSGLNLDVVHFVSIKAISNNDFEQYMREENTTVTRLLTRRLLTEDGEVTLMRDLEAKISIYFK